VTSVVAATRQGSRAFNCDAARVFLADDGTVAAAVVDGIGSDDVGSWAAVLCAETASRVGVRRGPLAGLLSAGDLVADPGAHANGVAVLAVVSGADPVEVAWIGDCRAYGWDGAVLRQYTTDHTVGEQLRRNGAPLELAAEHDNWIKTSLADAVVATVYRVQIDAPLVLLTSDGVHDQVDHDVLTGLVAEHNGGDLQALAEAIVAAAREADGYRDDATVVVIARPAT
jgi:PPM family protein phosphatase